jgi:hypothetical protein
LRFLGKSAPKKPALDFLRKSPQKGPALDFLRKSPQKRHKARRANAATRPLAASKKACGVALHFLVLNVSVFLGTERRAAACRGKAASQKVHFKMRS